MSAVKWTVVCYDCLALKLPTYGPYAGCQNCEGHFGTYCDNCDETLGGSRFCVVRINLAPRCVECEVRMKIDDGRRLCDQCRVDKRTRMGQWRNF